MGKLIACMRQAGAVVLTLGVAACLVAIGALSSRTMAVHLSSLPEPPGLTSPHHDSYTNNPDVLFGWSANSDTLRYELRYAKLDSCVIDPEETMPARAGQFVATDSITVVTLEPQVLVERLSEGSWCWQVRAMGQMGEYGAWSEVRKFTVDVTHPLLTIKQPLVPGSLAGTIDEKAKIELILDGKLRTDVIVSVGSTLNGSKTYDWSLTLPELANGDHTYVLRALDSAGNKDETLPASLTIEGLMTDKPGAVTSMQHEMLPLVSMGPLIFITSPVRESADIDMMTPVIDSPSVNAMAIETPMRIERLARSDLPVSDDPVQATERGWLVFGIAWYWWVVGASSGIALVWILLLRIQLTTRLNWIGAV